MPQDRYPDADILAQRGHWDDATREVVLDRVYNVPPFRFFSPEHQIILDALCARVIPQGDRPSDQRVPLSPWIDARCYNQAHDGFRFDNMPPHEIAWRWGLDGLDETAKALFDDSFAALPPDRQDDVLRAVAQGEPPGDVWRKMPAKRWWVYVAVRQISGTYYAHPFAWDEIGFGGPAYPRGYASLNFGAPEPWEAREATPDDGDAKR